MAVVDADTQAPVGMPPSLANLPAADAPEAVLRAGALEFSPSSFKASQEL